MAYNKYYVYKRQKSTDNGQTWEDVYPLETKPYGSPIGTYDTLDECEGIYSGKFRATYLGGTTYELPCDGDSSLTTGNTKPSGYQYTAMTSAEIGSCVTSIDTVAFQYCSGLTSVTIPSTVTSIGGSAFEYCTGLTSIDIPNSVTTIGFGAFDKCYSITNVRIPDYVTIIDGWVFTDCHSLTSVTIPNGVISIGDLAFANCSGLTSIDIPDSVISIGEQTFQGCKGLTSITIPDSVTSISTIWAFASCPSITSMVVDSNNTAYDSRNNCNAIIETSTNYLVNGCKNTIIPNTVTTIGYGAFMGCSGLTSINIPDSVTSINAHAFDGCTSLIRVNSDTDGICIIPNSVTSIGRDAFYECSGFTSITIPTGVTSISDWTFFHCYSLARVNSNVNGQCDIPNNITSIGIYAFTNCRTLTSIVIPSGVTSIGQSAFNYCRSLTSVTINATTPPTLGNDVFDDTNNCPIYVPAASVNTYKSASGWSDYSSRIQAIPT